MHFQKISTCTEATLADTTGVFPLPGAEGGSVALVRSPQKRKIGGKSKKASLSTLPMLKSVFCSIILLGLLFALSPLPENRKGASSTQR